MYNNQQHLNNIIFGKRRRKQISLIKKLVRLCQRIKIKELCFKKLVKNIKKEYIQRDNKYKCFYGKLNRYKVNFQFNKKVMIFRVYNLEK